MFCAAFVSVRQYAVMPRDTNEATLHVGIRCGACRFQYLTARSQYSRALVQLRSSSSPSEMKPRNEIVEVLTAAFRKSRLSSRFDIRVVVEKIADQLEQINDEHCRQIALAKARLDAETDALKREKGLSL